MLQSAQFSAAEEKNSQEQKQYEKFMTEPSKSRAETTTLNDDSKETLESITTQYEEFMTESSESRADKVKEATALNDDSAKIENMTVHGFALESESDLEEPDEQSSDEDGPFWYRPSGRTDSWSWARDGWTCSLINRIHVTI